MTFVLTNGHRLQWETARDCYVLLYPEGVVELDETAAAVLDRLARPRSWASLIASLSEEYEGAELATDVRAFLEEARGRGWVTCTD